MFYNYNGIQMEMVKTNIVSFDAVYTDDKIDYLYTHYRIDIVGTINPQTLAVIIADGILVDVPGTLPATTVAAIRHALLQPRQQLQVTDIDNTGTAIDAQVMLYTPGVGFVVDAKDGPTPLSCTVISVSGARTMMLRWVCEGHIRECPEGTFDPVMISNRWSDSSHINQYQLMTRTASGKAVFNKAYIEIPGQQVAPDDSRDLFFPPVSPGCRRVSVDVVQNSAGTECVWKIVDQETMYVIGETDPTNPDGTVTGGSGMLEINGRQAIVSQPPDAGPGPTSGITLNQVFLTAHGSKVANQWQMLQSLIRIAGSLIQFDLPNSYIRHASLSRSLGMNEKWVELQVVFWQAPTDQLVFANLNVGPLLVDVGDVFNQFVPQNDGVNPGLLNDGGSRGSAFVELVTQQLTGSACDPIPDPLPADGSSDIGPPSPQGPPPDVNVYTREIIPEYPSSYNDDPTNQEYPYTTYKVTTRTSTDFHMLGAPIAGPTSSSSSSSSGSGSSQPTTAVFQLALPTTKVILTGMAERIGAKPQMPLPTPNDPSYILTRWDVSAGYPIVLDDGVTPVTRCDFVIEYLQTIPPDPTNPAFIVGQLPWTTIPPDLASLNADDFTDEITGF